MMNNENRKVQRSIAVLIFSLIGLLVFACAVLFGNSFSSMMFAVLFTLIGTGLCVAGLVYAVLVRRECSLTGPGITGVILSGTGIAFGVLMTAVYSAVQIFGL